LQSPASPAQRTLTRLTFDDGLQIRATWSPDGRFIAYSSNRGDVQAQVFFYRQFGTAQLRMS
jgi:Tol biopolymer transport system component